MTHPQPIIFGVAGGTASGKTTIARSILEAIGTSQIAYLPHDAYYRDMPQLSLEARVRQNYDHPDSFETDLLIAHVRKLLRWQSVHIPVYDFAQYRRTPRTVLVEPAPVVLIDGILIFTNAELRQLMDVKIYVDTDADVRFIRRLKRDMEERGRSLDSIINQYLQTVRLMHLEFVEPSKRYADVIIPEGGLNRVATDMVVSRLQALLRARDQQPTAN
ncbi:MAG: uridine kinase [Ardenticatenales bacterium]|nr:uridine kinase [Ardenticatenales bacterium]